MGDILGKDVSFVAKLHSEDRPSLDRLKRHPRETYGDVVHWLIAAELARRDDAPTSVHSQPLGASA
jgi:hypothetical protein